MAAAGAPLRCTVPECRWFTGAALTPEQQTHQLAKHLRDVHATFPRESKLFVLPPPGSAPAPVCGALEPTGAIGDDGGQARCTRLVHRRGTMHEGNGLDWYDVAPPSAPEEPDDAEARAYLDALRMVARALEVDGMVAPAGRAVLLTDIRRVVALHGRTLELGGAREGRS